jgi:hypothetical protein
MDIAGRPRQRPSDNTSFTRRGPLGRWPALVSASPSKLGLLLTFAGNAFAGLRPALGAS